MAWSNSITSQHESNSLKACCNRRQKEEGKLKMAVLSSLESKHETQKRHVRDIILDCYEFGHCSLNEIKLF